MQPPHQTYVDNLAKVRALIKPHFSPDLTDEEIIASIRSNSERLFSIHRENDVILQDILFSKTAETLTAEEASQLSELADALFNYNRSADVGIAYRIHQLLYAYAVFHNDVDFKIRELYFQGITLYYLNVRDNDSGVNLFIDEIGWYFREGASYLDQYDSLENPKTRAFIVRCLGNIKYGVRSIQSGNAFKDVPVRWNDYMKVFDKTMSIVESPRYREMNPEIPWDNFAYTLHYDRTTFLANLRSGSYPEIAQAVLESAEYVYRHQEQIAAAGEKSVGIRTQYVYAAARYHNGLIPLEELVRVLLSVCEEAQVDDFSGDNIWAVLNCPEYLKHYMALLPMEDQDALEPRLQTIADKQTEFLFRMPPDESAIHVSRTLQSTASHAATRDPRFSQQLLDYILACHPPTFVHSEVVAMLTRWFCEQLAQKQPRLLDGVFGLERPADDPASLDTLLEKAYRAGLYHDMGKCMLLSYVGQYSRRLLDEEFNCIKLHPRFGCALLDALGMQDLSCAAKFHHRAYDMHGGYPMDAEECAPDVMPIVNIITIVDSLDAGTDNVGRSYAASKTFAQLVDELRAGQGRRYAPEIVRLFDDPVFYAATEKFLEESRLRAYLDAYCVK